MNFPIVLTVSLNTVDLFNVIPLEVFKFIYIYIYLIVSDHYFYYFVMKNFVLLMM